MIEDEIIELEAFLLSEYHYVLSLYQKYKKYEKNVLIVSLLLLLLATGFVALDLVRVSPLIIYTVAMAGALYYALRTRVESRNYDKLVLFLEEHEPKMFEKKDLMFFIDYQLTHYFGQESAELIARLHDGEIGNDEKATEDLKKIVTEIHNYYEYLSLDTPHEQNMEISLQWYRESLENRKSDRI